jgi:hypothetical protein
VSADDSGTRAVYVPKILAVIHLVVLKSQIRLSKNNEEKELSGIVPAIYRRSARGMQDLISDGLISLMPHYPAPDRAAQFGSLGRQFFARELCNAKFDMSKETPKNEIAEILYPVFEDLRKSNTREHLPSKQTSDSLTILQRLADAALWEDLNGG